MIFNDHHKLVGQHAFLSASQNSWLNYDADKLILRYKNAQAAARGTELHEFAATCIRLKQKLPRSKKTLNAYVNDAIGFGMTPEQVLFYSQNCFGTADTICFNNDILRIHDLKTGVTPAHMEQLFVYDALFCLEYNKNPRDIQMINRIYQFDDCIEALPEYDDIMPICDTIMEFDKILSKLQLEEE